MKQEQLDRLATKIIKYLLPDEVELLIEAIEDAQLIMSLTLADKLEKGRDKGESSQLHVVAERSQSCSWRLGGRKDENKKK